MTRFRLRDDALDVLLRANTNSFSYAFLDGGVAESSPDFLIRWAELGDVIRQIVEHRHDTFAHHEDIMDALCDGSGGGLGIPIVVSEFVARELVVAEE
ncbi:hypothetical protein QNA19_15170 [Rhodococcus fascians]|uniref:hypothetical protein n=1 Tax=Rhodococcoides fascians TaxID=1828 RepID=UPI0024B8ACE2|nr:hypothetical protein [Rhodococcus fascians]MDJ0427273.1 hypothetical protein [Rhodococcus fascians]